MGSIPRTRTATAGTALVALVGAVMLALSAAAFACTPSNLIGLSTTSGGPGTPVGVTGAALLPTEVVVHWNGENGPVLARATPAELKSGAVAFAVPDVAPGYYVVTATQTGSNGNKLLARATFQVLGPASPASSPWPTASQARASNDRSGGGLVLGAALGFAGLALLGGAGMALVAQSRRRAVPVAVTTEQRD